MRGRFRVVKNGDAQSMRDVTGFQLERVIAEKPPIVDTLQLVSTGLFALSFPVLVLGIVAVVLGWASFKLVSIVYLAMAIGGVAGGIGAQRLRRRLFIGRAVDLGRDREEAEAFWTAYDWGDEGGWRF